MMTLWKKIKISVVSFPSCHDFKVLQCIVGCVGSSGVYVWSKAVAHSDWLCGQLDQTLTQTAETALLWKNKRRKTYQVKNNNTHTTLKKTKQKKIFMSSPLQSTVSHHFILSLFALLSHTCSTNEPITV